MTHAQIKVDSHTIAVSSHGTGIGPTFVLVHGIGVSGRYFGPLITELSSNFRVICLDLPGFGDSSRPRRPLNIPELATIVARLIAQQKWDDPILVGHSMGCQVVSQVLLQDPQLATKAILISPTANDAERTIWQQTFRLMQDTLNEPLAVNLIIFGDYIRCGIRRYIITSRHMLSDHIEDRLGNCSSADILIIRGERDVIVPRSWATKLAGLLAHGSLVEVQHAPHLVQYVAAQKVAQLCAQIASTP